MYTIVLPFVIRFHANLVTKEVLKLTELELIHTCMHAYNLTFGVLTNLLKLPLNIALQAKCSFHIGNYCH